MNSSPSSSSSGTQAAAAAASSTAAAAAAAASSRPYQPNPHVGQQDHLRAPAPETAAAVALSQLQRLQQQLQQQQHQQQQQQQSTMNVLANNTTSGGASVTTSSTLANPQEEGIQQQQQQQQQQHRNGSSSSLNLQLRIQRPRQVFQIHGFGPLVSSRDNADELQLLVAQQTLAAAAGYTSERLNGMSIVERNQALQDLHGIVTSATSTTSGAGGVSASSSSSSPETLSADFKATKMRETSQFATLLVLQERQQPSTSGVSSTAADGGDGTPTNTAAYVQAMEIDIEYVLQIQWLCLRADDFDSSQAASRLVSFFTFKLRLFGPTKLCQDISLMDLNQETDLQALIDGRVSILPQRDSAGRSIIVAMTKHEGGQYQVSVETWVRFLSLNYFVFACPCVIPWRPSLCTSLT